MTKIKQFILFIIPIIFCVSCSENKRQSQSESKYLKLPKVKNTKTKFTIIEFNKDNEWVFNDMCNKTKLTKIDIVIIDSILNVAISKYNKDAKKHLKKLQQEKTKFEFKKDNFILNLDNYKRQYVGVKNQKNEKEVWINCFCGQFTEKNFKEIEVVEDGGNCFFNLKINLKTKKYYDFNVNGEA